MSRIYTTSKIFPFKVSSVPSTFFKYLVKLVIDHSGRIFGGSRPEFRRIHNRQSEKTGTVLFYDYSQPS